MTGDRHWVGLPDWIDTPESVLERVDAAVAVAESAGLRSTRKSRPPPSSGRPRSRNSRREASSRTADEETSDDVELSWGSVSAQSDDIDDDPSEPTLVASVATTPPALGCRHRDALSTLDGIARPRLEYQCAPTTEHLGEREDLDRLNSQSCRAKITAAVLKR
ncbi:hypothetical protein GS934_05145 [Rhodococcus hoagii]|nr:hypothetical protein [Prescottella equi]NKZ87195.1 hypothetical protein [Prescottella equi]